MDGSVVGVEDPVYSGYLVRSGSGLDGVGGRVAWYAAAKVWGCLI